MPKKERAAKAAAHAMNKELDSEMTEEERQRKEKAGMGLFGGINKGEETLFGPKQTKEEKKAAAEAKRAEMAEKKAAKKAAEAGDGMPRVESSASVVDYEDNFPEKKEKKMDSKTAAKKAKEKSALEAEVEGADTGGGLQKLDEGTLKFAVCTGVLASRFDSRDIKVDSFSISLFGKQLFEDQKLELTYGHRYGLVAQNGSGKTTLLKCIATRQVPIPDFVDIWYLDKEADPSDRTALESVIDTVRNEKERLEKLEEDIMSEVRAAACL